MGLCVPTAKEIHSKFAFSVKYIVDSNLLLLYFKNQSFKVVTEVPKSAFSDTIVLNTYEEF